MPAALRAELAKEAPRPALVKTGAAAPPEKKDDRARRLRIPAKTGTGGKYRKITGGRAKERNL